MGFNFKEMMTAAIVLFAIIDIIGSTPVIVGLRKKVGHIQSEKATIVAGVIMISFLFVGKKILKLIGIGVSSFAVAGAIVLLFLAIEMILGIQLYQDDSPETASVIPLAFPLIAGPGTMTSLLSLRSEYHIINIVIAVIINSIIVYVVLKSSDAIEHFLGNQGIAVIRKIFGVVLLAIAVKLFASNIQSLFQ
jgi:multiple antibiotic resistance protein